MILKDFVRWITPNKLLDRKNSRVSRQLKGLDNEQQKVHFAKNAREIANSCKVLIVTQFVRPSGGMSGPS